MCPFCVRGMLLTSTADFGVFRLPRPRWTSWKRPGPESARSARVDLDEFAWLGSGDGAPGVPGDLEDHECDRESDQRVGDWCAEADGDRAGDDAERDVAVGAGVVAVGDQGGAGEFAAAAESDLGGELVAEEADQAGGGEHPEMGQLLRIEEAHDRLVERDAGGDEDGEHDGEAGEL